MLLTRFIALTAILGTLAIAQDKPAAPARRAAAASASPVDDVIALIKGGMSESTVIKTLQRQNKPMNLTPTEMLKLQKAGASENLINVMVDPASAPAAAAAPVVAVSNAVTTPRALPPTPTGTMKECAPSAPVTAVTGAQKRRLAVQAFDYSAVRANVATMFGNDVQIGQGIRAMLSAKMGQSKTVVLLEREKLKALMAEQDLGATNRVKKGSNAKVGNVTGADAILFGDIVIFGRDDQAKGASGGGVSRVPGIGGVIGGMRNLNKTDKAVVAINLRLVDAETGEVLETGEARGESSRKSTDWGAMAGTWRGAAAANTSMTSSNFAETIIGEATNDAVTKIVAFLDEKVPHISAKNRSIEGRVATIDGCMLYLSVGGDDGIHVGDHFEIHQIISEVINPETKELIDKQTVKVGDMYVATVRDKTAIGQYGGKSLDPGAIVKPGYSARLVMQ